MKIASTNTSDKNKSFEQKMAELSGSGGVYSILERIVKKSGQITAEEGQHLIAMSGTLPDFIQQYFSDHIADIRAAINNATIPDHKKQSIVEIIDIAAANVYQPFEIKDIKLIDKLPEGAKSKSIAELFAGDDMKSFKEDWKDMWTNMAKSNDFFEINAQGGQKKYFSPKAVDAQISERGGSQDDRMGNIQDILSQLQIMNLANIPRNAEIISVKIVPANSDLGKTWLERMQERESSKAKQQDGQSSPRQ